MKKIIEIDCGYIVRELKKLNIELNSLSSTDIGKLIDDLDEREFSSKEIERIIDLLLKLITCIDKKIEGILYTVKVFRIVDTYGTKLTMEVEYEVH